MQLIHWIFVYVLTTLFWLWIILWGGASYLQGWKAWAVVHWFAGWWSAEQIRLYAVVLLFFETIWFILGLFKPGLRFAY